MITTDAVTDQRAQWVWKFAVVLCENCNERPVAKHNYGLGTYCEQCERWLWTEVLPSIFRHGCYPPPEPMTCAGPDRAVVQPLRGDGQIVIPRDRDTMRGHLAAMGVMPGAKA